MLIYDKESYIILIQKEKVVKRFCIVFLIFLIFFKKFVFRILDFLRHC